MENCIYIVIPRLCWQNVQEWKHFYVGPQTTFASMNDSWGSRRLSSVFSHQIATAKSTSLGNVLENELIINSVSPSEHTAALMKYLLLCNLPLGLLPNAKCCSHKPRVVTLHTGRKGLAATFICLQQIIGFHLKFTTSKDKARKRELYSQVSNNLQVAALWYTALDHSLVSDETCSLFGMY